MEMNHRNIVGEIDIIAKGRDRRTIIFVEVKALAKIRESELLPEDNMSFGKIKRLRKTCEMFVAKHPKLFENENSWRMDLVALEIGNKINIRHYENI